MVEIRVSVADQGDERHIKELCPADRIVRDLLNQDQLLVCPFAIRITIFPPARSCSTRREESQPERRSP